VHIVAKGPIEIWGQLGKCGGREVFIGFASAATLAEISFVDQLDEQTGEGYQRRFHQEHSKEFKRYIQQPGASTIPLTFNLRDGDSWSFLRLPNASAPVVLQIDSDAGAVMSQVDCQHRLGHMGDSDIPFAFMTYIGLSVNEEIELFRVINGKAKGLSGSLLDFTEAKLLSDSLSSVRPELFIAIELHQKSSSPWFQRLDLGGERTVGMSRQASLRTMQNAAKRFLKESKLPKDQIKEQGPFIVMEFWKAICLLLPCEWDGPRKHMLTKGIGVYSLMSLAGILVREGLSADIECNKDYFISKLSPFIHKLDWSNHGSFEGLGGVGGADKAFELINAVRARSLGVVPLYG